MKRFIAYTLVLFSFSLVLSAADFKFQFHTQPSVRQLGSGTFSATDKATFDKLYSNPALLSTKTKHALFPSLDIRLAGPLEDGFLLSKDPSNLQNKLIEIINKNNGIKAGANAMPLLSFGGIMANGFGWGVSTQAYAKAIVPSLLRSDVSVGVESIVTFGYGFDLLKTDMHKLAFGFNGKLFAQGETSYSGSPMQMVSAIKSFSTVPLYITPGIGLDAGMYYSFADSLDVGLVCKDLITGVFTSSQTYATISQYKFDIKSGKILTQKLGLGIGYSIPVAWSKGVISSFRVSADYADFVSLFMPLSRNPILEFSMGTELTLFKVLSLRAGLSEMYPHAGLGVRLGKFNIDFAMYGSELGFEPGSSPILGSALYLGFYW